MKQLFCGIVLTALVAGCGGGGGGTNSPNTSSNTPPAASVGTQMGGARQGVPLNLTTAVTSFAGSGIAVSFDGIGTAASFHAPHGITTDGTNLYVVDKDSSTIRKIVIATGAVTTLAGRSYAGAVDGTGIVAAFNAPTGITTDGTNLYVADNGNNMIRKIVMSTGVVTTLAGSVLAGSTDGTGTAASFDQPYGITTDGTNLYVADSFNSTIRKIVISTGVVTTLAGNASLQSKINAALNGTVDGIGAAATFFLPVGITTDGTNLYVMGSSVIRKIVIATGAVSTLAGSVMFGNKDGTGTAAAFASPFDITTDGTNLYVPDSNNRTIRKIVISTGVVTTLAGSGAMGTTNGTGTAASFAFPMGITTDGISLYVADSSSNTIRKIQ